MPTKHSTVSKGSISHQVSVGWLIGITTTRELGGLYIPCESKLIGHPKNSSFSKHISVLDGQYGRLFKFTSWLCFTAGYSNSPSISVDLQICLAWAITTNRKRRARSQKLRFQSQPPPAREGRPSLTVHSRPFYSAKTRVFFHQPFRKPF